MSRIVDLREDYLDLVKQILRNALHDETGVIVYAFGSRVRGKAKEFSDLDLAIDNHGKAAPDLICRLLSDFEESDLPFKVDVIDLNGISQSFYEAIKNDLVDIKFDWKKVKLGEVIEIIGGGTPKTSVAEYWNGDIPWITPKDLSNYNFRYIGRGERNITSRGLSSSSAVLLPQGSVLLTSRAPVGYVAIAKSALCTNQGFKSLLLKDDQCSEFYYYLLKCNKTYLESMSSGSTFKELSGAQVKDLEFIIPPLHTQREIASILGSLDDKIEANRVQSKTLEAIAQALFKSWFVDFEPVKAKSEGRQPEGLAPEIADLFPSSFVDSPLGKIPDGWEVKRLGEFASFMYGKALPEKDRNFGNVPIYGSSGIIGYNDVGYVNSAGIIIGRKGTIGAVNYSTEPFWPIDTTFYIVDEPQKRDFMFAYHMLRTITFDNSDSAVPGLNRDNAHSTKLIIPPVQVQKKFHDILFDTHNKIISNKKQSQLLIEIRDALLPRLVAGKIRSFFNFGVKNENL